MRQPWVQARLTAPDLYSRHSSLEKQWHRLETLTRTGVKPSCLVLGNSMVLNGFDPQAFTEAYMAQTGRSTLCFNFGVDALTPVSAEALAQILVEAYHPELLIVGVDARDFAIPRDAEETAVIADMAWTQYRLGRFNLLGWLVDNSYLFRYRVHLADTQRLFFLNALADDEDPDANRLGFEPLDDVFDVTAPPQQADESYSVQYLYRVLADYAVRPENRTALDHILALKEQGITVIMVEMPVPPSYRAFFDAPVADYQAYVTMLREHSAQHDVPLLESSPLDLIPDDGWADYAHVNRLGAAALSAWLGEQVGRLTFDAQLGR